MSTSFLRREVIDERQQAWLGRTRVTCPLALSVLTGFVAVAVLAIGAFLCAGHYTRKAHVAGVLVPDRGLIRLLPPQAATVAEVHVREGASVRQGEVLFVLSIDRDTGHGDTQGVVQASLAARERSLRGAAAGAAARRAACRARPAAGRHACRAGATRRRGAAARAAAGAGPAGVRALGSAQARRLHLRGAAADPRWGNARARGRPPGAGAPARGAVARDRQPRSAAARAAAAGPGAAGRDRARAGQPGAGVGREPTGCRCSSRSP